MQQDDSNTSRKTQMNQQPGLSNGSHFFGETAAGAAHADGQQLKQPPFNHFGPPPGATPGAMGEDPRRLKGGVDGGSAPFMGPGRRGVQGSNGTQHKGHYAQPSEQGTKDPESMSAVAFMHESLK